MTDQEWLDLIQTQLERFPDSQPADVFKLVFDVFLGPGTILLPELAADALRKRAATLNISEPQEWEEAVENLDAASGLARVHLRPYLRAGGDLTRLHHAIVRTAEQLSSRAERFEEVIGKLRAISRTLDLSDVAFKGDDLLNHLSRAARRLPDQPPRHSPEYEEAYSPAYCVVLVDTLGAH